MKRAPLLETKAKLLCRGARVDAEARELFERQNPSKVKRGGLSSGGKVLLAETLFVNFPFYEKRDTPLEVVRDGEREFGVLIREAGEAVCSAEVLQAPDWYDQTVNGFPITAIFTAHNRQLATAVFEDCALFATQEQCRFCVINRSLAKRNPNLRLKSGELLVAALDNIPTDAYAGITLNGGMTTASGRGIEVMVPVVEAIRKNYPTTPIAVEMTPPAELSWIDALADAGVSSLMMNLEIWNEKIREKLIPGKDRYCPKNQYLAAFERALEHLGVGKVSTCFVVGTEPIESLKQGIAEVVSRGVIPSPLAGRYFEDIPDYPFVPDVDWREFLDVVRFAAQELKKAGVRTTDRAGCVACGMCDLIKDLMP
ncbi:hypothetical protein DRN67_01855 [Candidatus Micrarchaeota archaeon]|nr:MAG: hypothetical protein DRN67_01855 [Candidatus Micrarchaeota archaeon]